MFNHNQRVGIIQNEIINFFVRMGFSQISDPIAFKEAISGLRKGDHGYDHECKNAVKFLDVLPTAFIPSE